MHDKQFLMQIPTAFQPYVEVFQALDGYGQLWSPTGQFLGRLCSKSDYINSILNPKGAYGSPYSLTSIHNRECLYGGDNGKYSPFNPNCEKPPVVFYRSQPLFVLSLNLNLKTKDLKIIDPYLVLAIYEALSDSVPEPVPETLFKFIRSRTSHTQLQAKLKSLKGNSFNLLTEVSPEHRQHNQKPLLHTHPLFTGRCPKCGAKIFA